jgi:processive 1,2-diacylglycerol beta-glucosyltransferase
MLLFTQKIQGGSLMIRPTALILTAKYGSGHVQVANVLAEELKNKGFQPVISDLFGEAHPIMSQVTQSIFIKSFSHGSSFYKWFYYGTNKLNATTITQFSRYLGRKRFLELVKEHQPRFVITTFPLHVAPFIIKKSRYAIPTYTVITDYIAHPFWINPSIDHYFVASDSVKQGLMQHHVDEKSITVSGIPIRSDFYGSIDKEQALQKYRLSKEKRVVTILAGAQGVLKNVKTLTRRLLQNPFIQVIVICGKNKALFEKLMPLAVQYPGSFRLLGYVDELHEILMLSQCLITKPGGITITEAAALNLPLILYKPVPGQETENAKFFESKGAAVVAHTADEMAEHVQKLMDNKPLLERMKTGLQQIHQLHSSSIIADHALQELNQLSKITQ